MKKFKVSIDLYSKSVWYFVNCSYKEMQKAIRKMGFELEDDSETYEFCQGICDTIDATKKKQRTLIYVWIRKFKKNDPVSFDTLMHENFHATVKLMAHTGHELSNDSEESYAYVMGLLATKTYEKLRR